MINISAYFNNESVKLLERVSVNTDGTQEYKHIANIDVLKDRNQQRLNRMPKSETTDVIKILIQQKLTIELDANIHRFELNDVQYEIDDILESPNVGSIKVYDIELRKVTSDAIESE